MADLADLAGAGRSEIFPGYTLSPLDLTDFGECEKELEAKCIAVARAGADGQHPDAAYRIISDARRDVENGKYAFGTDKFTSEILKAQHLPLLAALSLRHRHPEVTRDKAGELIRAVPNDDQANMQDVVCSMAGYTFTKKNGTTPQGESPPTGTPSSTPSESSESVTPTPADSPSPS